MNLLFNEPAAAMPTLGVILFLWLLAASGAWFWFGLGIMAALLLILGSVR
jgi:hypothetical protein